MRSTLAFVPLRLIAGTVNLFESPTRRCGMRLKTSV